jgi:hypothetical protein
MGWIDRETDKCTDVGLSSSSTSETSCGTGEVILTFSILPVDERDYFADLL